MPGKRALIISLGTGIGPGSAQSLAGAVAFSVNSSGTDKVLFVVTRESREKMLPLVLQQTSTNHEVCEIDDPEDINQIYNKLAPSFKEMRSEYMSLVVDYTSGTKAMTGALAILGSIYEADALSYVTGQRHQGVVVTGTEKLLTLRPFHIIAEKRIGEAINFFNHCQFDVAVLIISQMGKTVPLPGIMERITPLKSVSQAFSLWDRFDHKAAFEELKKVDLPAFDDNKAFLGKLLHTDKREPYLIADLLSNARRRGEIEQNYDDAVGRLYRVTELIAQYQLRSYGIEDTGDVPRDKIPTSLLNELGTGDAKVKVGLHTSYRLLATKGDKIGLRYQEDRWLQNLLRRRNTSILAHGLKPVEQKDYLDLRDAVIPYAKDAVPSVDTLMSECTFDKWPE